jgi:hypothetical protein
MFDYDLTSLSNTAQRFSPIALMQSFAGSGRTSFSVAPMQVVNAPHRPLPAGFSQEPVPVYRRFRPHAYYEEAAIYQSVILVPVPSAKVTKRSGSLPANCSFKPLGQRTSM